MIPPTIETLYFTFFMKTPFYPLSLVVLFSMPLIATAQDPSAALELRSTTQGFLPPRMTTSERQKNITDPALGLLIYNKNNPSLEIYDGARWIRLGTSSSSLLAFLDADKDTGILLEDDQAGNTTIRFKTAGTERMSINASGTVQILGALKDAASVSGTLRQFLSSTTTGTTWVDGNLFSVFDAANQTGIRLDKNLNDDVIRFETAGAERMSINASGTVQIFGALKDAASVSGTLGQVLSSTGTSTRWVDPAIQFKDNSAFNALNSSTVSPGAMVVNTSSRTLHVRNQANDDWAVYEPSKIYHDGPFDSGTKREYRTVVSRATGQVWLDRNIGASQRATSPTDADAYGDYYSWTDVNGAGIHTGQGPEKICPFGFRLPTKGELEAELPATRASTNGAQNAFNLLFLTLSGYHMSGSAAAGNGNNALDGAIWSSSYNDSTTSWDLAFNSSVSNLYANQKTRGMSIRCLKD